MPLIESLTDSLKAVFKKFSVKHALSFLLDDLLNANIYNQQKVMYVNVQKHHLDIAVIDGNNLSFLNSYYYQTPDDFLYYVLNAAKQTGFDAFKNTCVLLGEVTEDYPQFQLCKHYLSDVQFADRPANYTYCDELAVLPTNYHYNLFCIQ